MKKTTHLLLFFSFLFFLKTAAFGQILRGRVFQYLSTGDSIGLPSVQISVLGKPLRTQTKADGSFLLYLPNIFEGEKIQLNFEKNGWRVLNDTVLKSSYQVENGMLIPSVYMRSETDFMASKTPFYLSRFIQKIYQKRLLLLNREAAIFSKNHAVSEVKIKNISDRKEELLKRYRFLLSHCSDLAKILDVDNQLVTDSTILPMVSLLKEGKVEEASNIINEAQYKALKQKHLESPRDTKRWSELCFLAFLKAECAMMQFNAVQADFYFNESLGQNDPQDHLNISYYDGYIEFLSAFGESKKVFENIQTLLIKANMRQNTEGVALAYRRLEAFYFDQKVYDLAEKAGKNALLRFDTLVLIQKKAAFTLQREDVMRQLAFIYAEQNSFSAAAKMGEKALQLPSDADDFAQNIGLRLLVIDIYQKMYEQTELNENWQKAVFHIDILEKEFSKNGISPPSVNSHFEQYESLKTYIEDIHKPRFLSKRKEIHVLEGNIKSCKNTAQTIYYRSKIIVLLEKLDKELLHKSLYINHELVAHYQKQAVAQNAQKNFREALANTEKADKILRGIKNENRNRDVQQNAMPQDYLSN